MSSPSSPTQVFDVSSRRAEYRVAWMTLVGCVAATVLLATSIEGAQPTATMAAAAIFIACAIAAADLWRAGWLGGRHRVQQVIWLSDGRWWLTDSAGRRCLAQLRGQTRVAGRCIWLSWHAGRRARYLLLCPGDIPADDLRRLAVRLRVGVSSPPQAISAT
jgi:hypothetical protein